MGFHYAIWKRCCFVLHCGLVLLREKISVLTGYLRKKVLFLVGTLGISLDTLCSWGMPPESCNLLSDFVHSGYMLFSWVQISSPCVWYGMVVAWCGYSSSLFVQERFLRGHISRPDVGFGCSRLGCEQVELGISGSCSSYENQFSGWYWLKYLCRGFVLIYFVTWILTRCGGEKQKESLYIYELCNMMFMSIILSYFKWSSSSSSRHARPRKDYL